MPWPEAESLQARSHAPCLLLKFPVAPAKKVELDSGFLGPQHTRSLQQVIERALALGRRRAPCRGEQRAQVDRIVEAQLRARALGSPG